MRVGDIIMHASYFRLIVVAIALTSSASFAGIAGSRHDLSTGPNQQKCVFCHAPHNANTSQFPGAPLWNRNMDNTTTGFTTYTSDTMDETCDATPGVVSLLCLSCHDKSGISSPEGPGDGQSGNVSAFNMHNLVNDPITAETYAGPKCLNGCHGGGVGPRINWQIGPDLSNDHPVSMNYPVGDPTFFTPPDSQKGWRSPSDPKGVRLYQGKVECPSCHDPHDVTNRPFLRKTLADSSICFVCHNK